MAPTQCTECGATYSTAGDACAVRFDALLALDHSHQEPLGSRHGQAFAAFALEHPTRHAASLDRAWAVLYRIYCLDEAPSAVMESMRRRGTDAGDGAGQVPRRPSRQKALPSITIADLADFDASTYAARLDAWCRAALASWGGCVNEPAV